MPRAKAQGPIVVEYERRTPPGGTFEIRAFRDGSYSITRDGKTIASRASQLNAFFGAAQWPSNRLQAESLKDAQMRIEALG